MIGHTIQKCYKIHGYPPRHKFYRGRKVAAVAQPSDVITGNIPSHNYEASNSHGNLAAATPTVQTFTSDQCNQLL